MASEDETVLNVHFCPSSSQTTDGVHSVSEKFMHQILWSSKRDMTQIRSISILT